MPGVVQNTLLCCTRYFAVAEKSRHGAPMAYIYQYPSLAVEQTLEHGTERAYSAAAFNAAGDRLATVGSYPDFMLTVWDWKSGCTLLRSKAFSQEVYCVSFCPSSDGALVTSGILSASQLLFVLSVSMCTCIVCWTQSHETMLACGWSYLYIQGTTFLALGTCHDTLSER